MIITQLNDTIRPTITALGYELWGCEYFPRGQHSLLRVYIDSQQGITLDDCGKVSDQLNAVLAIEELIQGSYTLEVSSPGVSRPLLSREHYQRYLGFEINVKTRTLINGRRKFTGTLQEVRDDCLILMIDGQAIELPVLNIDKANLVE